MRRRSLVCAACALLPLSALLYGGGILVFDDTAFGQWIIQIQKMKDQLEKQTGILNNEVAHLNHVYQQAKYLTRKSTWVTPIVSWRYYTPTNYSGKTGPWNDSILDSSIGKSVDAWLSVATQLPNVAGPYTSFYAPVIQDDNKRKYGHIEIQNAIEQGGISTIASVRSMQDARSVALTDMEKSIASTDPAENTANELASKQAAATMMLNRQANDTNKLLVLTAELLLQQQMERRNESAESIRRQAAYVSGTNENAKDLFGGTGPALTSHKAY